MNVVSQIPWWVWIPVALLALFWWARTAGNHRARPKPLRNGVMGTARVISVNSHAHREGSRTGRVVMHLILQAPGIAPTPVRYEAALITTVWPEEGMNLPASIDASQPTRFRILWGDVSNGTAGIVARTGTPATYRASTTSRTGMPNAPSTVTLNGRPVVLPRKQNDPLHTDSSSTFTNTGTAPFAEMSGRVPQGGPFSTAGPSAANALPGTRSAPADVAPLLERLAALQARGILTQDEFEAQKAKLLAN